MTKPATPPAGGRRPVVFGALILIGFFFASLCILLVFTRRPWVDEAWFTGPALDLVTRGKSATLLLDPAGSHVRLMNPSAVLRGIDDHTLWVMPVHLLQLAAWGKVFGFSFFSMRMPSVLWGAAGLLSLGLIVRRLYLPTSAAMLAVAILAIDFGYLGGASDARMDMTCAAMGLAALAVYLSFREVNFHGAVIAAHVLTAAAVFTHPNGVFGGAGLVVAMLWFDRKRLLRPMPLLLMAAPYLLFGSLWILYCRQFPGDWASQFSANSSGRGDDFTAPWRGVWRELDGRFRNHFFPPDSNAGKLKIAGLLLYLGGLCTLITSRPLRTQSGCRLLLWLTLIQFLCLSVLANNKNAYYLVYILPYFAAAAGIAISYLWSTYGSRARLICAVSLTTYAAVQLATVLNLAFITATYRKEYVPAVNFLKVTLQPGDLVTGAAELGFSLGFYNPQLRDDVWLGYWTGRRPTVVVVDRWYYQQVFEAATARGFPTPDYFRDYLAQFRKVYETNGYQIYRRMDSH